MSFNIGMIALNKNNIGELTSEAKRTTHYRNDSLNEAATHPSNRRSKLFCARLWGVFKNFKYFSQVIDYTYIYGGE